MNTHLPILKELNQRRSVRAYLPKAIEQEKLDALFEAARWAPSCSNKQDWHYYALMGDAREKMAGVLTKGNVWALKAPLLICATYNTAEEIKTGSRTYGAYDTGLSVMSLVAEAEHQGLRARQMAGWDEDALRAALALPAQEVPIVVIALGYEDTDIASLDPMIQEREKAPRERKPIETIVTIVK